MGNLLKSMGRFMEMEENIYITIYIYIWLVVFRHPSEKWWSESQLGLWHSQYIQYIYMESHKIHVPNHHPVIENHRKPSSNRKNHSFPASIFPLTNPYGEENQQHDCTFFRKLLEWLELLKLLFFGTGWYRISRCQVCLLERSPLRLGFQQEIPICSGAISNFQVLLEGSIVIPR